MYLSPSGDIDRTYIDLVSGSEFIDFINAVFDFTGYNTAVIRKLHDLLNTQYDAGREYDMYLTLHFLYDLMAYDFPANMESICTHTQARSYLMFCILKDIDECLIDFAVVEEETRGV